MIRGRPSVITAICIIIALAIGGAVAVVTLKKPAPSPNVIRPADLPKPTPADEAEDKEIKGDEASPGQPTFENVVRELLFVSLDDVMRGFISTKIDTARQRQYFTDQGWTEYQAYVAAQKIILRKRMGAFGSTPQSKGEIKAKSQEYENLGKALTSLTADIYFCFGISDSYACDEGSYKLKVTFSGNIWTTNSIKITGWSVAW